MNPRNSLLPALFRKLAGAGSFVLVTALLAGSALLHAQGPDERPRAVDLLPDRTSVYVQIDDVRELVDDMKNSNLGRMLADERIAPLVGELYAEAQTAFRDLAEDELTVSLEELQSLPQGEICFAVVTPRRKKPVFALIMDVSQDSDVAQRLIDRGRQAAEEDDATLETGDAEGVEFHTVRGGSGDEDTVYYTLHQGTFVATNNEDTFREMMVRWHGTPPEKDRTLATNRKFVTIMNKCKSTEDLPMSFSFFVDPIMLVRSAMSGSPQAGIFLGALPVLGLDGLSAFGGAALFNEKDYESIFHGHLLLSNPRNGVFEMIALKPGFYDPESFVPDDVSTYMTTHWDFAKFVRELETIVDTFSSEGTFRQQLNENVEQEIDINFDEDFIANLKGRVTYVAWINDPPRFNSQSNALVVQLEDEEKGLALVEKILDRIREDNDDESPLVTEEYEGVTIYRTEQSLEDAQKKRRREWRARREGVDVDDLAEDEDDTIRLEMRPTFPCFCFIDNNFIFTESPDFLEHLIDTFNGENERLADNGEFQAVMSDMRGLMDGNLPSGLMYARPDQSMRMFYDMLDTDNTRELLESQSEDNQYLGGIKRAIEENPLPPFDEIAHYFPPQGGFVMNDETGFHILVFQQRAVEADE